MLKITVSVNNGQDVASKTQYALAMKTLSYCYKLYIRKKCKQYSPLCRY